MRVTRRSVLTDDESVVRNLFNEALALSFLDVEVEGVDARHERQQEKKGARQEPSWTHGERSRGTGLAAPATDVCSCW